MPNQKQNAISYFVVVTSNYPSTAQPTNGTFVRQFAHAIARQRVRCTVIQPVAIHRAFGRDAYPYHETDELADGSCVEVFRPRFLSLSARDEFNKLGVFSPSRMTFHQFTAAVRRTLQKQSIHPDVLYGHFLFMAGAAAVSIGQKLGVPSFPCAGEGEFWTVRRYGFAYAIKALGSATGVMANSTALKSQIHQQLTIPMEKIGVFPNGTDLHTFKSSDKAVARKRFNLPADAFLVCSIGNFLYKKGIVRVGEAIDGIEGIAGVFAGSGPVPPLCKNIALCGRVNHVDIPALISACDVFVLPTLIEGSCNAIVEAMACGLPIISSIGEFNDDLLTEEMSIRVDPMDVPAIRRAIIHLRDDAELRRQMALAARERSRQFDVDDRAGRTLAFMESLCGGDDESTRTPA